jgi:hypothetical protein
LISVALTESNLRGVILEFEIVLQRFVFILFFYCFLVLDLWMTTVSNGFLRRPASGLIPVPGAFQDGYVLSNCGSMQMTRSGGYAGSRFTTVCSGYVSVINPGTGTGTGTWFTGVVNGPYGIYQGYINANWYLISHTTTNLIQLYTASSAAAGTTFTYASGFSGVRDFTLNSAATRLYVADATDGIVYVIDVRRCLTATLVLPTGTSIGGCTSSYYNHTSTCQLAPLANYTVSGGSLIRTCSNGQFTGTTTLLGQPCGSPPAAPLGTTAGSCIGASIAHGATCTYSKLSTWGIITGSLTLTCNLGVYTARPVLEPNPCAIVPPAHATLGSCLASQPSESNCTLLLDDGYGVRNGSVFLTCTLGVLSPIPDIVTQCSNASLQTNLPISGTSNGNCTGPLLTGTFCTLEQLFGWTFVNGSFEISCNGGNVSATLPYLTPNDCTSPPALPDGLSLNNCVGTILHGDLCDLSLNNGYSLLSGSLTIQCLEESWWTIPTVLADPCALVLPIPGTNDGNCTSSISSDSSCTLMQLPGWSLQNGSLTIDCHLGNFSTILPTLTPDPCTAPTNLPIGINQGGCNVLINSGDTCTLSLMSGYSTIDTLDLLCSLGTFSSLPIVTADPCIVPLPINGTSSGNCTVLLASGSSCLLVSAFGYTLTSGQLSLSCLAAQLSSIPVLTPNPCSITDSSLNEGILIGACNGTINSGSSCILQLAPEYHLASGSLTISCFAQTFDILPTAINNTAVSSSGSAGSWYSSSSTGPGAIVPPPLLISLVPIDTSASDFVPWPIGVSVPDGSLVAPGGIVYDPQLLITDGSGTGSANSVVFDLCSLIVCHHGGQCSEQVDSITTTTTLTCQCPIGFFGPNCETAVLACPSCIAPWNQSTHMTMVGVGLIQHLSSLEIHVQVADTEQTFHISNFTVIDIEDSSDLVESTIDLLLHQSDSFWSADIRSGASLSNQWQAVHFIAPAVPRPILVPNSVGTWTVKVDSHAHTSISPVGRILSSVDAGTSISVEAFSVTADIHAEWMFIGTPVQNIIFHDELLISASTCTAAGFFPIGDTCAECPAGCSICPGNGICITAPGYWATDVRHLPVKCSRPNVCQGAIRPNSIEAVISNTGAPGTGEFTLSDYDLYTQGCNSGYVGIACDQCASDHYMLNDRCWSCGSSDGSHTGELILAIIISIAIFGGLSLAVAVLPASRMIQVFTTFMLLQKVATIGQEGAKDVSAGLAQFFVYLNAVNFDVEIFSPACSTPHMVLFTQLWFTLGLALAAIVLFILACYVRLAIARGKTRRSSTVAAMIPKNNDGSDPAASDSIQPQNDPTSLSSSDSTSSEPQPVAQLLLQARTHFEYRRTHVALIVGSIFFLKMHLIMFQIVQCIRIPIVDINPPPGSPALNDETELVLQTDLSIRCYEGQHLGAAIVTWALFLFYSFTWPIACFIYLSRTFTDSTSSKWVVWLAQRLTFLRPRQFRDDPNWPSKDESKASPAIRKHSLSTAVSVHVDGVDKLKVSPSVQQSSNSVVQTDSDQELVHADHYGILFLNVRREMFYYRLCLLYLQFYFGAITVLVESSSAQLCALAFSLGFQAITVAFTHPWQKSFRNIRTVLVAWLSMCHSLVLLTVQPGWSVTATYFWVVLALVVLVGALIGLHKGLQKSSQLARVADKTDTSEHTKEVEMEIPLSHGQAAAGATVALDSSAESNATVLSTAGDVEPNHDTAKWGYRRQMHNGSGSIGHEQPQQILGVVIPMESEAAVGTESNAVRTQEKQSVPNSTSTNVGVAAIDSGLSSPTAVILLPGSPESKS